MDDSAWKGHASKTKGHAQPRSFHHHPELLHIYIPAIIQNSRNTNGSISCPIYGPFRIYSRCLDLGIYIMERSPSPTGEDNSKGPILSSLRAPVSPPRRKNRSLSRHLESKRNVSEPETHQEESVPQHLTSSADKKTALIESGKLQVANPLSIFSSRLRACTRPLNPSHPQTSRLPIPSWTNLYQRNQHPQGNHFVVHQHDHPIAGPHYDLRLQFSESSSVSWSIMYGLPGDPNSRRLNRNAVETRVHCFWVCVFFYLRLSISICMFD